MTTTNVVVDQVRQRLGARDILNKLATGIDQDDTSVTLSYEITGVGPGSRLSIDAEDFHVWEADTGTKTASPVERGLNGSTATSHDAGAIVRVNAEFSTYEIVRAINEEIAALPGEGIFYFDTVQLTANASTVAYDLEDTEGVISVHSIEAEFPGYAGDWRRVPRSAWMADVSADATDFPSGTSVAVDTRYLYSGSPFRVLYKTTFASIPLTSAGLALNVETTTGLDAAGITVLVVGAAIRLTQGRPSQRATTRSQPDPRRAEEVTVNDARLAVAPLQLERQEAIKRLKWDQLRRYGA